MAKVGEPGNESDVDKEATLNNYKGIYYGDTTEKYLDPVSGCHFRYLDLCQRMLKLKKQRKIIDKRLGLITSSQERSPKAKAVVGQKKIVKPTTSDGAPNAYVHPSDLSHYEDKHAEIRPVTELGPQEDDRNMIPVKV